MMMMMNELIKNVGGSSLPRQKEKRRYKRRKEQKNEDI